MNVNLIDENSLRLIIGDNLEKMRNAKGFIGSAKQFVDYINTNIESLNLSDSNYRSWARGDSFPPIYKLYCIAQFCDLSIDYFINKNDNPNKYKELAELRREVKATDLALEKYKLLAENQEQELQQLKQENVALKNDFLNFVRGNAPLTNNIE